MTSHNFDKEQYILELQELAQGSYEPVIHLLSLGNVKSEIDKITDESLILNLCDGCDTDGVPGPCVALELERRKFPNSVGCDSIFIKNTLSKTGMKKIMIGNSVLT